MSAQCWCFTIWAKNEKQGSAWYGKEWEPLKKKPKDCQFVGWQMEAGKHSKKHDKDAYKTLKAVNSLTDETDKTDIKDVAKKIKHGKVHYQGYIQFYDGCTKGHNAVKNALNCPWANVRISRGTSDQNMAYITKLQTSITGTYKDFGTMIQHQGFRSDWIDIVEKIKEGKTVHDIIGIYPKKLMYINAIQKYYDLHQHKTYKYKGFEKKEVMVIFGDSDVNKTRHCEDNYNNEEAGGLYKYHGDNGDGKLWFDGYDGQETLLIDEFYGGIKHSKMLNLLDGYHYQLPVKGGFAQSRIKRIIITTNKKPEKWYSKGLSPQLNRRINKGYFHITRDKHGDISWEEYKPVITNPNDIDNSLIMNGNTIEIPCNNGMDDS